MLRQYNLTICDYYFYYYKCLFIYQTLKEERENRKLTINYSVPTTAFFENGNLHCIINCFNNIFQNAKMHSVHFACLEAFMLATMHGVCFNHLSLMHSDFSKRTASGSARALTTFIPSVTATPQVEQCSLRVQCTYKTH